MRRSITALCLGVLGCFSPPERSFPVPDVDATPIREATVPPSAVEDAAIGPNPDAAIDPDADMSVSVDAAIGPDPDMSLISELPDVTVTPPDPCEQIVLTELLNEPCWINEDDCDEGAMCLAKGPTTTGRCMQMCAPGVCVRPPCDDDADCITFDGLELKFPDGTEAGLCATTCAGFAFCPPDFVCDCTRGFDCTEDELYCLPPP